jgi:hypothetical protein
VEGWSETQPSSGILASRAIRWGLCGMTQGTTSHLPRGEGRSPKCQLLLVTEANQGLVCDLSPVVTFLGICPSASRVVLRVSPVNPGEGFFARSMGDWDVLPWVWWLWRESSEGSEEGRAGSWTEHLPFARCELGTPAEGTV